MTFHVKANIWLVRELHIHLGSQIYLHVVISMCYCDLQIVITKILHIHHIFFWHIVLETI